MSSRLRQGGTLAYRTDLPDPKRNLDSVHTDDNASGMCFTPVSPFWACRPDNTLSERPRCDWLYVGLIRQRSAGDSLPGATKRRPVAGNTRRSWSGIFRTLRRSKAPARAHEGNRIENVSSWDVVCSRGRTGSTLANAKYVEAIQFPHFLWAKPILFFRRLVHICC